WRAGGAGGVSGGGGAVPEPAARRGGAREDRRADSRDRVRAARLRDPRPGVSAGARAGGGCGRPAAIRHGLRATRCTSATLVSLTRHASAVRLAPWARGGGAVPDLTRVTDRRAAGRDRPAP